MKEIVGIRPYSFADQRTGELVEGCSVFLQWKDDEVDGVCCEAVSLSRKKLDGYEPHLGDLVKVGYNRYNKADFMVKLG